MRTYPVTRFLALATAAVAVPAATTGGITLAHGQALLPTTATTSSASAAPATSSSAPATSSTVPAQGQPAAVTAPPTSSAPPAQGQAPSAAAVPTTSPALAQGQAATASGIELGLRLGYSVPFGTVANGGPNLNTPLALGDTFSGRVPFWLDAGYRIEPHLYVGLFLQLAIMTTADNSITGCGQGGITCSGHDLQYGVDVHVHILPERRFDPWVGAGFGYESATLSLADALGTSGDLGFTGWQYVNFQLGGDYKPKPNVGLGPFVTFSLGQYSRVSVRTGSSTQSEDLPSQTLHEWLTIGVRGAFDVNL
jgi:hypothetical protein